MSKRWLASLVGLACGACGSASGDIASPERSSSPPRTVVQAFDGDVPAACWGSSLDLTRMGACRCKLSFPPVLDSSGGSSVRAHSSCGAELYRGRDLTKSLALDLVPERKVVRPGERVQLELRLTNRTQGPLEIVFTRELFGNLFSRPMIRVTDARGRDWTTTGDCGEGMGGDGGDYLIALEPNGLARRRIEWNAASMAGRSTERPEGWECVRGFEPLPPGAYTLTARMPLDDSQRTIVASTTIVVE
jgi:hypothetical protein